MSVTVRESSQRLRESPSAENFDAYQLSSSAAEHEVRNFGILALYQIVMRTGWIFKTESIIMPAVLDSVSGGGTLGGVLRGCLPVLNRIGHSIPPILFSRRLNVLPQKRTAAIVCTLLMSAVFGLLAAVWLLDGTRHDWWMPMLFIACYTLFFMATGINNLSFGTLQGKLVQATRRGRMLSIANVLGAVVAILAASWLLPQWLTADGGRFEMIFGVAALCFLVAAMILLLLIEPKDNHHDPDRGVRHLFASAWRVVQTDRDFRRLAGVAICFGCSLSLFPHYQALGRSDRLHLTFHSLLGWVVVQNIGTALFSMIAGPIADRRGNRLVMQLVMIGIAAMPVTAIALSYWTGWGATLYPIVFLFIGLTPVGFKTLNNYALEISSADQHPRYLSTLGLCFALPLLFSPAIGWVVVAISFDVVFLGVSAVVLGGWLLTFRLREPRHAILADARVTVVPDDD